MVHSCLLTLRLCFSTQNWEDEDVPALLDWLEDKLAEDIQLLSSFDKYKREVLGGSLDWSPMHTSDQFWRENTAAFEEKDFQILRVLLKLVESSREVQTSGSKVEDGLFMLGPAAAFAMVSWHLGLQRRQRSVL